MALVSEDLTGCKVVNRRGENVGKIRRVLGEGDHDGASEWGAVRFGFLHLRTAVVPPSGITDADELELPRETRDAKPPAMEEGSDSPLTRRRRKRAKELGVPGATEPDAPPDD